MVGTKDDIQRKRKSEQRDPETNRRHTVTRHYFSLAFEEGIWREARRSVFGMLKDKLTTGKLTAVG